MIIISGKREQRAAHWNEIRKRVTTHEGEFLSGAKGQEYQEKWAKKYLGRDLHTRPISPDRIEQFEKTGK